MCKPTYVHVTQAKKHQKHSQPLCAFNEKNICKKCLTDFLTKLKQFEFFSVSGHSDLIFIQRKKSFAKCQGNK